MDFEVYLIGTGELVKALSRMTQSWLSIAILTSKSDRFLWPV